MKPYALRDENSILTEAEYNAILSKAKSGEGRLKREFKPVKEVISEFEVYAELDLSQKNFAEARKAINKFHYSKEEIPLNVEFKSGDPIILAHNNLNAVTKYLCKVTLYSDGTMDFKRI